MALLGLKKNNKKEKAVSILPEEKSMKKKPKDFVATSKTILIRPRVTEKASLVSELQNVYVFEVAPNATSREVAGAIFDIYKVMPLRVNMVRNPSKRVFTRGKWGTKSGIKKAYVYLNKGDKIEII